MTKALLLHTTCVVSLWLVLGGNGATAQTLADDPAFVASRQATEAFNRQDYPKAASLAREAIAHYPQHLLAHYVLGQVALATSKWEDAAQAFSTVLQLYPTCFVGQRDLGIALTRANRLDEAARAYQAALALQPEHEDVQVGVSPRAGSAMVSHRLETPHRAEFPGLCGKLPSGVGQAPLQQSSGLGTGGRLAMQLVQAGQGI